MTNADNNDDDDDNLFELLLLSNILQCFLFVTKSYDESVSSSIEAKNGR